MTIHRETRVVRAPRMMLFDIVADVEKYPEFLPFWRQARIYRHLGDSYYTEQELGFGFILHRFRTKTRLMPPARVEVTSNEDIFREFSIIWELAELREGCQVTISLNWELCSFFLQRGVDIVLPETARVMVNAFEVRALQQLNDR